MRVFLAAVLALIVCGATPAGERPRNLVGNGDFERGPEGATKIPGWTEVDGLTTFFVTEPDRGRVLKIDTDVNLSEANERWEKMALPPEERPPAEPKGPTRPPKYDTVGGTTGAKIFTDYIRVEPGMRYRLKVDVDTSAPTVMIFIKGYAKFQGGFRKYYQAYKNIENTEPTWKTYERTFNPTFRTPKVTHIRIMPYAYWPPGEAWVDNVSVTRLGPERKEGAATEKSLLENGDFEGGDLHPWTAEGVAGRVERGSEGACGRVGVMGALTSGRVPVDAEQAYVLRLRVLPAGAVLKATVEGLIRFEGSWVTLAEKSRTAPPDAEGWVEMDFTFDLTQDAPQVTHVRARFTVVGNRGFAFVDDVAIEPAGEGGDSGTERDE